jgi:tight adherence protein C
VISYRRKMTAIKSGAASSGAKPTRMVFRRLATSSASDASAIRKAERIAQLKEKLRAAGFEDTETLGAFWTAKVLCGVVGFLISSVLLVVLDPLNLTTFFYLLISALIAGLSISIPDRYIDQRASARLNAIELELPNVIDLLLLSVHSGLSLDDALRRIVLENGSTPLHEELAVLTMQLSLSPDRDDVYKKACERIRSKTFTSMITSVLQAERYGVSMSETLSSFADELRVQRTLLAEVQAGKLPTQMTLVMMVFILPAFLVMVAYPLIAGMFEDLL